MFCLFFQIINRSIYSIPRSSTNLQSVLTNPGDSWKLLNHLDCVLLLFTFATKNVMEKEQIEAILDNASEEFLDRFFETILNEINSDEPITRRHASYCLHT